MNKKGQAAMEFLTTYGWAFLVILVVIAGLYYMDVFDFSKSLTTSCISNNVNIQCTSSFMISSTGYVTEGVHKGALQIELKNNLNQKINFTSVRGSYIVEKSLKDSVNLENCELRVLSPTACGFASVLQPGKTGEATFVRQILGGGTYSNPSLYCGLANNLGKQKTYLVHLAYKIGNSNIVNYLDLELTGSVVEKIITSTTDPITCEI